ncbi:NAD(P)/FAD-dependent oxidoreductase [Knoellia sp. S7-12]|uniref:NAD(P)/FAD-dependent oxidoreductase n=1 Tax=Knoellia sp. S7-12 TaxID=3126698 RepID=UPI0033671776
MILAQAAAGLASAVRDSDRADVVVIGAGPAGSAAAAHLGAAGIDVLVLERTPSTTARRGAEVLSPRAVAELDALGLTQADTEGWHRATGVRFVGGGMRLALAWPDVAGRPGRGFVRSRAALDESLSAYAVSRGARLRRATEVTGLTTDASGRVSGVSADGLTVEAAVVIDASGAGAGVQGARSGVAATADFVSPRHSDDHLESWLELSDAAGTRLPGHGWIVGRGDGHVTVGVGALADDTSATTDKCAFVLRQWLTALPANWQLTDATMTAPISGSRLGTHRDAGPRYANGVLRVGDAAQLADPLTGEGLTAALASGRVAAEVVAAALAHGTAAEREGVLAAYATLVDGALGRRRTLGRVAARLIDRPWITHLATTYALPRERLMKLVLGRLTTPNNPAVETCVTPSTMGRVIRAAAHPGTERGVDQR